MSYKAFPVIDAEATGENILRLRKQKGLSVRDVQAWFGFEEPQAIYKWQKGKSLPSVDNLYALGALLDVPLEQILVPRRPQLNMVKSGQQDASCCPPLLYEYGRTLAHVTIFPSLFPWQSVSGKPELSCRKGQDLRPKAMGFS